MRRVGEKIESRSRKDTDDYHCLVDAAAILSLQSSVISGLFKVMATLVSIYWPNCYSQLSCCLAATSRSGR